MTSVFVNLVLVFSGGALGATLRYWLGYSVAQRAATRFPLGTLVVNLIGTVIIGVLARNASVLGARPLLFADIGFVGAFTTFSSLSYETWVLLEQGLVLEAFVNPVLSVALGLFGVAVGLMIGSLR